MGFLSLEFCTLSRLFVPEGREVYAIYFMSTLKRGRDSGARDVSERRERYGLSFTETLATVTQVQLILFLMD